MTLPAKLRAAGAALLAILLAIVTFDFLRKRRREREVRLDREVARKQEAAALEGAGLREEIARLKARQQHEAAVKAAGREREATEARDPVDVFNEIDARRNGRKP